MTARFEGQVTKMFVPLTEVARSGEGGDLVGTFLLRPWYANKKYMANKN